MSSSLKYLSPICWAKVAKKQFKDGWNDAKCRFSKNYGNKQRHEIQSAYFDHECFTLFTTACYFNWSVVIENGKINEEANLVQLPVVNVSNETSLDQDVAFSNNNILIDAIKKLEPSINTFHFWSDGCAGQFLLKYVFQNWKVFPSWLLIFSRPVHHVK